MASSLCCIEAAHGPCMLSWTLCFLRPAGRDLASVRRRHEVSRVREQSWDRIVRSARGLEPAFDTTGNAETVNRSFEAFNTSSQSWNLDSGI